MTATDELRRMLDERGVEYEGETDEDGWAFTRWHGFDDTGWLALSDELCGLLDLRGRYLFTPEQAIEATLGRGTCSNLAGQDEYGEWGFCCSECGARPKYGSGEVHIPSSGELPDGTVWLGDSWIPWRYCPNCGRRVS